MAASTNDSALLPQPTGFEEDTAHFGSQFDDVSTPIDLSINLLSLEEKTLTVVPQINSDLGLHILSKLLRESYPCTAAATAVTGSSHDKKAAK